MRNRACSSVVSYRNSTSNHNERPCTSFVIWVVSYRNSTSNHNCFADIFRRTMLYLIEILHQTTTTRFRCKYPAGCILSKFYIKPQRFLQMYKTFSVVSYRNSTSNHNDLASAISSAPVVSYRNSTSNHNFRGSNLFRSAVVSYRNSTSNHNQSGHTLPGCPVVSYRNSTSNHNRRAESL